MDDYKYIRMQDERERKNLARQASKRKNGSKSKKCSLPSDKLTPTQLKAMNGEVFTFAMNKPCSFEELSKIDKALIEEYLYNLTDRFNATVVCIAKMLGISEATFYKWSAENHINRPARRTRLMSPEESQTWNDWLASFGWASGYQKPMKYPVTILAEETVETVEEIPDAFKLLNGFNATINDQKQLDELYKIMRNMLIRKGQLSIEVEG